MLNLEDLFQNKMRPQWDYCTKCGAKQQMTPADVKAKDILRQDFKLLCTPCLQKRHK